MSKENLEGRSKRSIRLVALSLVIFIFTNFLNMKLNQSVFKAQVFASMEVKATEIIVLEQTF